jgi:hypothetical protein
MAVVNPRLRHTLPVESAVQVTDIRSDDLWREIMEFCDHPDTKGEYEWDIPSRNAACFYFTDANAGFEFKMRFG